MDDPEISRRRIISSVISNICLNAGFVKSEIYALETLSEMFTMCNLNLNPNYYLENNLFELVARLKLN